MSAHTPGPWTLKNIGGSPHALAVVAEPMSGGTATGVYQEIVANLEATPHAGGKEANAALIAAAPDLLAALEDVVEWVERLATDEQLSAQRGRERMVQAYLTIAKAKGKTK